MVNLFVWDEDQLLESEKEIRRLEAYLSAMARASYHMEAVQRLQKLVRACRYILRSMDNFSPEDIQAHVANLLGEAFVGLLVISVNGRVWKADSRLLAEIELADITPVIFHPTPDTDLSSLTILKTALEKYQYVYTCVSPQTGMKNPVVSEATSSLELLFRVMIHVVDRVLDHEAFDLNYIASKMQNAVGRLGIRVEVN